MRYDVEQLKGLDGELSLGYLTKKGSKELKQAVYSHGFRMNYAYRLFGISSNASFMQMLYGRVKIKVKHMLSFAENDRVKINIRLIELSNEPIPNS